MFQKFLVILFFIHAVAFARGNEGAGGDGVWIEGNLYLLDLVEQGVETDPWIDESLRESPYFEQIVRVVKKKMPQIKDQQTIEMVALKFVEVYESDADIGITLSAGFSLLQWRIVNYSLTSIDDEKSLFADKYKLQQAAIRRSKTVRIHRGSWEAFTPAHRAALIFHEVVYSFMQPQKLDDTEFFFQSSIKAREIVGSMFSQQIEKGSLELLFENHLPKYAMIAGTVGFGGLHLPNPQVSVMEAVLYNQAEEFDRVDFREFVYARNYCRDYVSRLLARAKSRSDSAQAMQMRFTIQDLELTFRDFAMGKDLVGTVIDVKWRESGLEQVASAPFFTFASLPRYKKSIEARCNNSLKHSLLISRLTTQYDLFSWNEWEMKEQQEHIQEKIDLAKENDELPLDPKLGKKSCTPCKLFPKSVETTSTIDLRTGTWVKRDVPPIYRYYRQVDGQNYNLSGGGYYGVSGEFIKDPDSGKYFPDTRSYFKGHRWKTQNECERARQLDRWCRAR